MGMHPGEGLLGKLEEQMKRLGHEFKSQEGRKLQIRCGQHAS